MKKEEYMELEEIDLSDLLMEWEEDKTMEKRKVLEEDVGMVEDWDGFLDDQTEYEFELWMLAELAEMGVDWNDVKRDLLDKDMEMEEEEVVEYIPKTPGLSRKLRALELEEDECICSNKCINVHGENDKVSYERPPLVEVEEVDECLCNVMCEGNHTLGIYERPLEAEIEEVDRK